MTSLFTIQYHGNTGLLPRRAYTISHQPMLPQTLTEKLHNAQNCDDKLQPLIQYLKDWTLPKDAPTV